MSAVPVEYDPFSSAASSSAVPVDYDPFSAPSPSPMGSFTDALKNAGTAGVKALTNIIGLPGTINQLGDIAQEKFANALGVDYHHPDTTPLPIGIAGLPPIPMSLPSTGELRNALFGPGAIPEYKPKNTSEDLAQSGMEGALTVAGTGGLGLIPLLSGATGGVGARLGPKLFPDHPILSSIAGGILGGLLPSIPSAIFPSAKTLAARALSDTPPQDFDAAEKTAAQIASTGQRATGAEILNNPDLLMYQRVSEGRPSGAPLREMIDARQPEAISAVKRLAGDVGDATNPRDVVASVKNAATGALTKMDQTRTAAVQPSYQAAAVQTVSGDDLRPIMEGIDQHISLLGEDSRIGKSLAELRDRIDNSIADESNTATIGPLDTLYKEFRDRIKLPPTAADSLKGADKSAGGIMSGVLKDLRSVLRTNDNYRAGQDTYSTISPVIKQAQDTLPGSLARSSSFPEQANALGDITEVRPEEIYKTARLIGRQDPAALNDWVALKLENAIGKAETPKTMTQAGPYVGNRFIKAIAPNGLAEENLRALFNTLPEGQTRWQAFQNVMKSFEVQSRRIPLNSITQEKGAAVSSMGDIGLPIPFAGGQSVGDRVGDWITRMRVGRNAAQFSQLFTDPHSIGLLREIAQTAPASAKAARLVGTLTAPDYAPVPTDAK
jgi:hypothetical protein